jgi:hypothetical protein
MIARDILAIPITTVASESSFSTGGRILSEHRSRLTPQMLEALMCSQSWFRHNIKGAFDCCSLPMLYSYSSDLLQLPNVTLSFLCAFVGQDDGKIDTFWSCLEDIEEEMKDEPCISSVDD